jgi:hypothetical protein
MSIETQSVKVDEKGRAMSEPSIGKVEAGTVDDAIDIAAERAYGMFQLLDSPCRCSIPLIHV